MTIRRLKTYQPKNSYYFLSANPLSQKSRINIEKRNDINLYSAPSVQSSDMHDSLYDSGKQGRQVQYDNLEFNANLNSEHGAKSYGVLYIKQHMKEYGDFSQTPPVYKGTLTCVGSDKFSYNTLHQCYELLPQGFCCFSVEGNAGMLYTFSLKSEKNKSAKIKFFCNRFDTFSVENDEFLPYTLSTSPAEKYSGYNVNGSNVVELINDSENTTVYLQYISVDHMNKDVCHKNWMKVLNDKIPLEDINIPGTHDSAAINKYTHTLYACHYTTISEQLQGGIRLLDVRIKVKKDNGKYVFVTCHGSIGGSTNLNEFQSLSSLFDECQAFLTKEPTETIIVTLKIDDWHIKDTEHNAALKELELLLKQYPIRQNESQLGTLGDARGKIILFNRINEESRFGYPIFWEQNTDGQFAGQVPVSSLMENNGKRSFEVYVQDHFQFGTSAYPEKQKFDLVIQTIKKKRKGDGIVYLNYGSACYLGVMGVYIAKQLVNYFGGNLEERPTTLGWILMDYEFSSYTTDIYGELDVVNLIIASNFGYHGCSMPFHIIDDL